MASYILIRPRNRPSSATASMYAYRLGFFIPGMPRKLVAAGSISRFGGGGGSGFLTLHTDGLGLLLKSLKPRPEGLNLTFF